MVGDQRLGILELRELVVLRDSGGLRRIVGSGKEGDNPGGKKLNDHGLLITGSKDDNDIAVAQFEVFVYEVAFDSKKMKFRRSQPISSLVTAATLPRLR